MKHPLSAPVVVGLLTLMLAPAAAHGGPLTVVTVSSPAYQYVFSPAGSVVVQDTVDTFAVSGAVGLAWLQSRTTRGLPGAPAEGLYRYSYRLVLSDVYGITFTPCIKSMTIRFASVVSTLDYNGDGVSGDQVFVVTSGALGSVGVASAVQNGSQVTVTFTGAGVCAGSGPADGDSSFFFGLVSDRSPKFVTATLTDDSLMTYTTQARAPKSYVIAPGASWHGTLQAVSQPAADWTLKLSIDTVRGRRFGGTLMVRDGSEGAPIALPVDGTLSESGHLQLIGRGRGVQFMAALSEQDGDEVFAGRCRLTLADGASAEGTLWLAEDARRVPTSTTER